MDVKRYILNNNSLTAQLHIVNQEKSNILKNEEHTRSDRLEYLSKIVGLPIDTPIKFLAQDVIEKSNEFLSYYNENKNTLVAMRLTPTTEGLPILRMRGDTLENTYTKWFPQQEFNPDKYVVTFYRHAPNEVFSTIFVVNKHGIFGELVKGRHHQLCVDQYDDNVAPITFVYNFDKLQISKEDKKVRAHLLELFSKLKIKEVDLKKKLQEVLNVTFYNDYICGYFETVLTDIYGIWFIDFNRVIGKWYKDYSFKIDSLKPSNTTLYGKSVSSGICEGAVFVMANDLSNANKFKDGSILVCESINADYIQFIARSKAVITNIGGILSHTAIVTREFGIASIVGITNATTVLKNGDRVLVDANQGFVKKLA